MFCACELMAVNQAVQIVIEISPLPCFFSQVNVCLLAFSFKFEVQLITVALHEGHCGWQDLP